MYHREREAIDVAIIGAMSEEVNAFLPYLNEAVEYHAVQTVFYVGKLYGSKVVVLKSGVGKVRAAVTTAFLLEHFAPTHVVNIGSAGGFGKELSIGDIVVSKDVAYHDVDVTICGCAYGQVPGMPATFLAEQPLVELVKQVASTITGSTVHDGLICTGDFFMSDAAAVALAKERFPRIIATDMEAAAIGHTCYLYNQPFVVIRSISDLVEQEQNRVDFINFLNIAAKNSAHIVATLVEQLRLR